MTDKAAISGTYHNLRPIVGRKVFQVHIEIPIEWLETFVTTFGAPNPDTWIAMARLVPQPAITKEPTAESSRQASPHRRKWDELSYAEQTGIRRHEPAFAQFVRTYNVDETPAEFIRRYCRVSTCADIRQGNVAGTRWELLESGYQSWLKAAEHVA